MEDSNKIKKETVEELFLRILSKAELNGFEFRKDNKIKSISFIGFGRLQAAFEEDESIFEFHINELFFNHNFAKALFGDAETCKVCGNKLKGQDWKHGECGSCKRTLDEIEDENWQYHLKKMVLSNNILELLKNEI